MLSIRILIPVLFIIISATAAFQPLRRKACHVPSRLWAKEPKQLGRKDGVYTRPSAAIEGGSGFFVPGLEGPRVRLVTGTILWAALAFVVSTSSVFTPGNLFANGLAATASTLILFQAAVEIQKQSGGPQVEDSTKSSVVPTSSVTWKKQWSIPRTDDNWTSRVDWAASSLLALTAADNILLVGPGKVIYSLGVDEMGQVPYEACEAALETLSKSGSGRVALPASHPAFTSCPETTRCVILQRVSESSELCWMVTSKQLLAGFTKQDLTWLGRMAEYISLS